MGKSNGSDLWDTFCEKLKDAGKVLQKSQMPKDELTLAEGYRHLMRMLRMGFEITYEYADSMHPQLAPAYCATMLSEGVTPDARYHHAFIDGSATYRITGKMGTAQNEGELPHAWFVGYLPAESPEIAIVAMVENSGEGSTFAAPLFREVAAAYYGIEEEAPEVAGQGD